MAMCYLDIKWNARGVTTICGHGNQWIATNCRKPSHLSTNGRRKSKLRCFEFKL